MSIQNNQKQISSVKDAVDAINAYRDHVRNFSNGKPHTRGVWFSLNRLIEIVDELKHEREYSSNQATPTDLASGYGITDGARIYFARYNYAHNGVDYGDRNTLYIVSTKQGPSDSDPAEGLIHEDYLVSYPKVGTMGKKKDMPTEPENTGELSPPKIKGIHDDFLPIE